MMFLARPFLAVCFALAALLFWQRPAPFLFSMTVPDWAKEYEKAHTPAEQIWGAMEMARELTRSWKMHLPLTEFIDESIKESSLSFDDNQWRDWYETHFSGGGTSRENDGPERRYFRPSDLPSSQIPFDSGHIRIQAENSIYFVRVYKTPAGEFSGKNIPAELLHPDRNIALLLLAAALGFMAARYFTGERQDRAIASFPGKGLKTSAAIFASGVALAVLPFLNYIPQESPPFVFVGGFLSIVGAIAFILFFLYFNGLRKILDGRDLLASWTFGRTEWESYVKWEYDHEKSGKRKLFILVSAIIVLVGLGFRLFAEDEDAANIVLLVLAGLIALLWFVALVLPKFNHFRKLKRAGEVFVGKSGVYIGGSFHLWKFPGSRLESVEYEEGSAPRLNFVYSYVMLAGRSLNAIRQFVAFSVPIPEGNEHEARQLPKKFGLTL